MYLVTLIKAEDVLFCLYICLFVLALSYPSSLPYIVLLGHPVTDPLLLDGERNFILIYVNAGKSWFFVCFPRETKQRRLFHVLASK